MVLVSSPHLRSRALAELEIAILGVSLGRSRATGRFGNMKMPSLIIWFVSKYFSPLYLSRRLVADDATYRGSYPWSSKHAWLGFGNLCLDPTIRPVVSWKDLDLFVC